MHDGAEQDEPDLSPSMAPARKRLRGLSVRMLMLLVLAVGGGLGWICHQARVQREAVAAIEAAGGEVVFDWQWDSVNACVRNDTPEPGWLTRQLGPGFFEEPVAVIVHDGSDDSMMLHIARLPYIEFLYLYNSNVTDVGAVQIRKVRRLRNLYFNSTPALTAKGVANLNGLNRLDFLWLPRQADDAYLVAIKDVPALTGLVLPKTLVTDAGMSHLRKLTTLTYLNLDETGIADDGLRFVAQLSGLQRLDLRNTRITDVGLASVATLSRLQFVALDNTAVTDAGLLSLAALKRCQVIDVRGTRVTPAGIATMKAKCPWMTITQ